MKFLVLQGSIESEHDVKSFNLILNSMGKQIEELTLEPGFDFSEFNPAGFPSVEFNFPALKKLETKVSDSDDTDDSDLFGTTPLLDKHAVFGQKKIWIKKLMGSMPRLESIALESYMDSHNELFIQEIFQAGNTRFQSLRDITLRSSPTSVIQVSKHLNYLLFALYNMFFNYALM